MNIVSTTNKNYEIVPYSQNYYKEFEKLVIRYFKDDLKVSATEQAIIDGAVIKMGDEVGKKDCFLDLLFVDRKPQGFIEYQIDNEESHWCEKPGWGFFCEVYVSPAVRGQKYGRKIAEHSEQVLREHGAKNIYLTADDAIHFWEHMGFKLSEEKSPKNHLDILFK